MSISILFISVLLTFSQSHCSSVAFREGADSLFLITDHLEYYYELKQPAEKHFLPYVLSEVSGLAWLPNGNLLCVEDEGGRAYEYDLKQRKITNAITFANPGDYEGVEVVDGMVYVLRSDGDLYEFAYTTDEISESQKIETRLSNKNDTEGLGYNPRTKRLMIACKEDEDIKGTHAKGKTVYEFDLEKRELIREPYYEITVDQMDDFFETNRDFKYDKDRIKFEPSGIAYNRLDGYYYLLASVGKLLLVLDEKGKIMGSYPIAPRILSQPEGICFAPNGDLYISSEGEGDRGYIVKFPVKKK